MLQKRPSACVLHMSWLQSRCSRTAFELRRLAWSPCASAAAPRASMMMMMMTRTAALNSRMRHSGGCRDLPGSEPPCRRRRTTCGNKAPHAICGRGRRMQAPASMPCVRGDLRGRGRYKGSSRSVDIVVVDGTCADTRAKRSSRRQAIMRDFFTRGGGLPSAVRWCAHRLLRLPAPCAAEAVHIASIRQGAVAIVVNQSCRSLRISCSARRAQAYRAR